MLKAWTIKTLMDDGKPAPGIYENAQNGLARIGWSSADSQDLRLVEKAYDAGSLTSEQAPALRCKRFLTEISPGDYILYPHQPEYEGLCCCPRQSHIWCPDCLRARGIGAGDRPAATSFFRSSRVFRCYLEPRGQKQMATPRTP